MALAAYSSVYTVLATAGLVLLRRSLGGESIATAITNPEFICGGALYAASFGTFLLALRRFEVLTVYPVFSGVTYASVTVAAAVFLGESLSLMRVVGIALVGCGVTLLVR
jgi:multidrug transporter EmrE-like cation transporter